MPRFVKIVVEEKTSLLNSLHQGKHGLREPRKIEIWEEIGQMYSRNEAAGRGESAGGGILLYLPLT